MMASKSDKEARSTCTTEELMGIIRDPCGMVMLPSNALDEVYPGIFIGEESSARNSYHLQRLGVTHVLNAAVGPEDQWHVNISPVYYKRANITQLGLEASDIMNCHISRHFDKATQFIHDALSKGKVLVHCREGVSRSVTLVIAYLMMDKHMTVQDALRHVRSKREVCPNEGFLQQLCDLNDKLTLQKHFEKPSD